MTTETTNNTLTVGYRIEYTADVEGDWCSQCSGTIYSTREEAQAALDADPTARPDCYGNECYPVIVECAIARSTTPSRAAPDSGSGVSQ